MLRHACLSDIASLLSLCDEARATAATLSKITGCPKTTEANLKAMCVSPHHYILVKEADSEVVGVLIGAVSNSWWHQGFDASDLCFYIQPEHRGSGLEMLDMFLDWAWSFPQTKQVFLSISYGGEDGLRTERLYDRKFKKTGSRIGATYSIMRGDS